MRKNKKYLLLFFIILINSFGCTKKPYVIDTETEILSERLPFEIIDHRDEPELYSFVLHTGLIFSCHYGIWQIKENQIIPDRLIYLRRYLYNNAADKLAGKDIEVTRFTIYANLQRDLKSASLAGASAGIGASLASSASELAGIAAVGLAAGVFAYMGPIYGCEGTNTGEYALGEVGDTNVATVFVVYLNTKIDGKTLNNRIVHSWNTDSLLIVDQNEQNQQLRVAINKIADNFLEQLNKINDDLGSE